tara:strand:- start:23 stop:559 length:537 start_codon:yes stop_codon:yes gene_type:complete
MELPFALEVVDVAHSYLIGYLSDQYDDCYGTHSLNVCCIIRELVFETEIQLGNWWAVDSGQNARYQFYKAFYNCERAHQAYEDVPDLKSTTMEDIKKEAAIFFYEYGVDNKDYFDNIKNYILQELDNVLDKDHQKEMAARAVLYRACSKAIWNPHCELGRRMAMRRLEADGLSSIIDK